MKAIVRCALFILIIDGLAGRALGDGKFFFEKVPPGIPYQRAFMLFREGSETLVLQSKYELSQSDSAGSLGWVVPAPSVPEIASADAIAAFKFFYSASVCTRPEVFRISIIFASIAMLFFLGGAAFLLLCIVEYPFLGKIGYSKATWGHLTRNGVIVTLVAFVLMIVVGIQRFGGGSDIEVIKAEKVGIYDIKVVRSQNAEAVLNWLKESGFGFNDNDTQVFKDYVDRGWCFVVAKVEPAPEMEEHKIVVEGMVAPLILKFEAEKAVYPLALTSTIGSETEILLYTFSEKKLDCGERLTLRYADKKKSTYFMVDLLSVAKPETSVLFENIPKFMYLCKFRKKLKPEEMKTDLELEFAKDNEPYREKKIVW